MRELVAYLRGKPALARVLGAARDRYRARGNLRCTVALRDSAEARALGHLGWRGSGTRAHLADIDAALRDSRFGVGLVETLEAYFGEPLVTKAAAAATEAEQWRAFVGALLDGDDPDGDRRVPTWLRTHGRHLRNRWRAGPEERRAIEIAARALREIDPDGDALPLPVLANRIAHPHALDVGTAARRHFDRALAACLPDIEVRRRNLTAEDREALLAAAGLVVDELSSTVLVAALGGTDPVARAARAARIPLALPLLSLDRLRDVRANGDVVFAVENPPVFRVLAEALADVDAERWPTIVCTSGHLSLAARRLLDLAICRGATVRYSGDLDPSGLRIARGLMRRHPEAVSLWRMDAEAHEIARHAGRRRVKPKRLDTLRDDFPVLSAAIIDHGAAYQEALTDLLVEDVRAHVR